MLKKKSYLFGFESQFDEDLLQFLVDKVYAELYNVLGNQLTIFF